MDEPTDRGLPFELPNLWQTSTLTIEPKDGDLFHLLDFDLPALADDAQYDALQYDLDLTLPELDQVDGEEPPKLDDIPIDAQATGSEPAHSSKGSDDGLPDFWTLNFDDSLESSAPQLRTWEAFEKKPVPFAERTAYLSEVGPAAFDAVLDPQHKSELGGVLPQDVSLRALCNLALGRSSIFFQWNDKEQRFSQTLEDVPTAGLSLQCSHGFAAQVMQYGSSYRTLQHFNESRWQVESASAAVTALKRSIASVLDAIGTVVSQQMPSVRSLLQLQGMLERPQQLLEILVSLKSTLQKDMNEEQTISALADRVHIVAETGSAFSGLLQAILAAVCRPWLSTLAAELALFGDQESWLAVNESSTDPSDEDVDLSMTQTSTSNDNALVLLSPEDRRLVKETKATLSILRRHVPSTLLHLQKPEAVAFSDSRSGTHWHWMSGEQTLQDATTNECNSSNITPSEHQGHVMEDVWADEVTRMEYLEGLDARMSAHPAALQPAANADLYASTTAVLTAQDGATEPPPFSLEHFHPMHPFDELRPLMKAQSDHLNTTLLHHLFRNCKLRKHLDLQRAFHLFGNGVFVTRLSTALFSSETQTAERRRGMVPTGQTMGLRLGAREGQRWPPASSELRLTLMGVLHEAYQHTVTYNAADSRKRSDLSDGLSFAIRELPDADIDRVMDTKSIYALDFLRLQYTAPAPLDAIFTPGSMQRYDDIFRCLLRLLRVLEVTTRLKRDSCHRQQGANEAAARYALQAHHFMSSLLSYILDVGIEAPWKAFLCSLDGVERTLNAGYVPNRRRSDDIVGLGSLRDMHNDCLDTIRTRLFLKRKQEKVRKLIEEVLAAILAESIARFGRAVLSLINALRESVDKVVKGRGDGHAEDEMEIARLLLVKLDWNGY